jgi:hypothetical protein
MKRESDVGEGRLTLVFEPDPPMQNGGIGVQIPNLPNFSSPPLLTIQFIGTPPFSAQSEPMADGITNIFWSGMDPGPMDPRTTLMYSMT